MTDERMQAEIAEEEEPKAFALCDDKSAEWALKKLLEAQKEHSRLMALIESEKLDLARQEKEVNDKYEDRKSYYHKLLTDYVMKQHACGDTSETKTQISYPLLTGKVVIKKATTKITNADESALTEWCKVNLPDAVKTTYKPDWATLKKDIQMVDGVAVHTPTGMVVEGIKEEAVEAKTTIVW